MANDIEKFDPSKLMEGVKDRIKATFVSLIPDEAWEQMLEKEIYIFTTGKIVPHHEYMGTVDGKAEYNDWEERIPYTDTPIYNDWGNVKQPAEVSPLRQMIRDQLREKFQKDLKEWLDGPEYMATRDQYGIVQISKAVEEIMVKHSGDIFRSIIADFMQRGVEKLRSDVQYASGQY